MKKLIITIIAGLFLAACNHSGDENDKQKIQDQIKSYRDQVTELQQKIETLEEKLRQLDDPEDNIKGLKVRVEEAAVEPFTEYFKATGELEAANEAFISPEISGQIVKIYVAEGQKVKEGQILAKLDTRVIEKNIAEIKTQLDYAETMYHKQKELWDKKIGSERQYLEIKNQYESLKNKLETLQAQYDMSLIHSPINGFVEEIKLKRGEMATPGMQMMYLVDLENLLATAMISEKYLPVVHLGEKVEITFPTFPGLVMQKPITYIGNVINKQNRTFKIQVKVDNKDGKLKPNLLVNIKINNYNSTEHIVIPSWIIREDLKGAYVYVAEKSGSGTVAKKKYVRTGRSYDNRTEILSGINPGDRIITDGYSNVSDGTMLQIAG